jgi:excisionase family DNA binding protein
MQADAVQPLLTVRRAAELLGVPPRRLRTAIRRGELPAVYVGRWARVTERDVARWVSRLGGIEADPLVLPRDVLLRIVQWIEVNLAREEALSPSGEVSRLALDAAMLRAALAEDGPKE